MAVSDIIKQIEKEAEAEIAKLNEARDKAIYEIQKEYEKKREQKKVDMKAKVENNAEKIKRRADTFANMGIRNHLLLSKRKLLKDTFAKIVESLTDSGDYVKILTALLKTATKSFNEGTVVPAQGKESVTKQALEASGTPFKLAEKTAKIQGGFILLSGQVEVNFSFESILEKELWGNLEIELSKLLFD